LILINSIAVAALTSYWDWDISAESADWSSVVKVLVDSGLPGAKLDII